MKSISIYKSGKLTNGPVIKPEAEALAWLESCLAKNKFGLPERPELDELGKETGRRLPAEFTVKIEEYSVPTEELRRKKYSSDIDPHFQEAVLDNMAGKPQKIQALLARYEQIKQEHPKNTSGINDNNE